MLTRPLVATLALTCLILIRTSGAQAAELLVSRDGRTTFKATGSEHLSPEDSESLRAIANRPGLTSNWAAATLQPDSTETLASVAANSAKHLPVEPETPESRTSRVVDHYQRAIVNQPIYREIQVEAGSAEN